MSDLHVIVISSIKLTDNTAASITLRRHLVDQSGISVTSLPSDLCEILPGNLFVRLLRRLSRSCIGRWTEALEHLLHDWLPSHRLLAAPISDPERTLVLTLACRNGWMIAEKYARYHNLPLVVRFDDWWPDIAPVPGWMKSAIDRRFRNLHKNAALSLCISEGMREHLGGKTPTSVILPIPEAGRKLPQIRKIGKQFRLCYLGNLYDYGPMLGRLAMAIDLQDNIEMEIRGGEPNWPQELKTKWQAEKRLHGFLEGDAFNKWFEGFDAYLVAMFFEPDQQRRVETCFATKLLDYSSLGRPVILWAPESSSIVRWARRSDAVVCVTSADPNEVLCAAKSLADDPNRCVELGRRIRQAYEDEFSPNNLQNEFRKALDIALSHFPRK